MEYTTESIPGRTETLTTLSPYLITWAQHSQKAAYTAWKETLPVLARRTRKDLLGDFRALAPFIAALGGAEAVEELFRAVQDVGRWWP